jgi:hypothetical protein
MMTIEPILQKKENPPLVQIPLGRNDKNLDNEIIRYDTENKRFFTDSTPLSIGCRTPTSVASPIEEDEDEEGEQ